MINFIKTLATCLLLHSGISGAGDNTLTESQQIFNSPTQIQHFMYVARERKRIHDNQFLDASGFSGAQVMYSWKDLEPKIGIYDFSLIEDDIALLAKHGKKLYIQLQDATFLPNHEPVPNYILVEPEYNGGVAAQCSGNGEIEGWVARRWDDHVRKRFHSLLSALAKKFDGVVAGINLQETAIGVEECGSLPAGFSLESYLNGIKENIKALAKSFHSSTAMQYANFMPGEWLPWDNRGYLNSVYHAAQKYGVAMGGPDLLPGHQGQENHALFMIREYTDSMTTGIAIQNGNYYGETGTSEIPEGPLENRVSELYKFARETLKVDYIFWVKQEPYFTSFVIPAINSD